MLNAGNTGSPFDAAAARIRCSRALVSSAARPTARICSAVSSAPGAVTSASILSRRSFGSSPTLRSYSDVTNVGAGAMNVTSPCLNSTATLSDPSGL